MSQPDHDTALVKDDRLLRCDLLVGLTLSSSVFLGLLYVRAVGRQPAMRLHGGSQRSNESRDGRRDTVCFTRPCRCRERSAGRSVDRGILRQQVPVIRTRMEIRWKQ